MPVIMKDNVQYAYTDKGSITNSSREQNNEYTPW